MATPALEKCEFHEPACIFAEASDRLQPALRERKGVCMAQKAKKERTRGRPFPPGVSGNPRGRPKGALGKRTLLRRQLEASNPLALLESEVVVSEALVRYYSKTKVFSDKDAQLGAKIIFSISDQMCAFVEVARWIERQEARLTKAE
jgi:hypothetical protein